MLNIFKTQRTKITDDILGVLTFRKSNRLDESYWNVDRKVSSVNELVEFYIYNNENGINKNQKKLILEIEKKYPELIDNLEKYLNTKIREIDSNYSHVSIQKDLDVSFINIPENPSELNKWEINFVEKKGFTIYGIEIENWNPWYLGISA
jgi:transcriptional antiterminator